MRSQALMSVRPSSLALCGTLCALLAAGCTSVDRAGDVLYGNWVTRQVAGYEALPENCRETGLVLNADGTFVDYSGAARVSGTYVEKLESPGYVLTLTRTADNGKPNCQGVMPQVQWRDPVRSYAVEVQDQDTLRLYPPGRPSLWFLAQRSAAAVD